RGGAWPPPSPEAPSSPGVPVLTDANHRPMPLDPYLLDPRQTRTIDAAYTTLVSRCMRRFGYAYAQPGGNTDPTGIGADAPTTRMDGYFGFQTMAHAKTWGYHPEGTSAQGGGQAPPRTATENTALTGTSDPHSKNGPGGQDVHGRTVPDHGCVGEANRLLTGSVTGTTGNPDFVVSLKFDTLSKGRQDPRTRAVFAAWSHCMKDKGFTYTDPLAAAGDPRWSTAAGPTGEELRVAVADQECRGDTNVVGVWFAVDYGYQREAVQHNRARLATVRSAMAAHLAAARRAVAPPSR
ncbi:hypothetical protein, partial [Streptomyces sp. 8L]|uniref:hypothetical protein n=1 Tax=Streptomyces sp. 8L TaxID=2877242 RepID=UPI001CD6F0E0